MNVGLLEIVLAGWRVESVNQLSVQSGGKDLACVVCWKNQIRRAILRVPDGSVMHVGILHGVCSVQHAYGFEISADLNYSRARKREVRLPFSRPAVDGKAAMRLYHHLLCLVRQML